MSADACVKGALAEGTEPTCPHCEYNLTGLPEPRCPECGHTFDWDQVRAAAGKPRPRIAFERAHGWRKIPAFFITAATVIFAPWIFARQITSCVSARHALMFAAASFALTIPHLAFADALFLCTWLTTATICIVLEALVLACLDVYNWRRPVRSARFWLLAGCYTSAIMLVESVTGPPPADLGYYLHTWQKLPQVDVADVILYGSLLAWSAGLACCYAARCRHKSRDWQRWIWGLLIGAAMFLFYALVFEHVGGRVYYGIWYDIFLQMGWPVPRW